MKNYTCLSIARVLIYQPLADGSGTSIVEAVVSGWLAIKDKFPNLVKQAVELIPQNYATSYIIEKPLLAKYLRDGLQKLDIWSSASS